MKLTIDIDEKFKLFMKEKSTINVITDTIKTIKEVLANNEIIKIIMHKSVLKKIIIIPIYVPDNPILYSYLLFSNYQLINLIKRIVNDNFKKVIKENYQVALTSLPSNEDNAYIAFDIILQMSLFNFISLLLKEKRIFKLFKKENKTYGESY